MRFTKVTLHRQLQHRWPRRWNVWYLAALMILCAPLAWAQLLPPPMPPPMPPPVLPPLLGDEAEGVAATSNTVVNFTLQNGSELSGKVIDANGMEVMAATVLAQSETEIFGASLVFEFDPLNPVQPMFRYRIVLPDGTYKMFVRMRVFDPAVQPPQPLSTITFDLQETVVVAGDTERDLMVPAAPAFSTLTGQVVSLGALPSEGGLEFQSEDGLISNSAQARIADGATTATYQVTLPAGTYQVFFQVMLPENLLPDPGNPTPPLPPDPQVPLQFIRVEVGTVTVSSDQVFDIDVPVVVTLSGKLQDSAGMALASSSILAGAGLLQDPSEPPAITPALCQGGFVTAPPLTAASSAILLPGNALGDYALLLVPGDYQVGVTSLLQLMPPATVPPSTLTSQQGSLFFPWPSVMRSIPANQMEDFVLPVLPETVLISGRVKDQQNQPVSKARVNAVSSMVTATPNVLFSNGVETNEMGDYQLIGLSGVDYTVTVCPPQSSNAMGVPTP